MTITIMMQEYFIAMLKRLRERMLDDTITCEDWNFILKNQVTPAKLKYFEKAIRLFSDNASCHEYNSQMIKN